MKFGAKLDFLMNITKTTNSALSLYTSLDASHISRLRRGQRSLAKNETYSVHMASYFARNCNKDYQRNALFDALKVQSFPCDEHVLAELIKRWFQSDDGSETESVRQFLSGFSHAGSRNEKSAISFTENPSLSLPEDATTVYYGTEGKRQAVIYLFHAVMSQSKPGTLLLTSDEDMDWLTGNRDFMAYWAEQMNQLIMRGNKIKIIHHVNRDLDEMLETINQWLPLYMTGAIEPYFYPKKRDGIFKRTLFISPDTGAVISSSVGKTSEHAANIFTRDKQAIGAYKEEYDQYLSLCKPLMRIFTAADEAAYIAELFGFEKEQTDTIIRTGTLSLITMPECVAESISLRRKSKSQKYFMDYFRLRMQNFLDNLQYNSFVEIIQLPAIASVKDGMVKIALSDMFDNYPVYYSAEEFVLHLENIRELLEAHDNFHVYFSSSSADNESMIYLKDGYGALVANTALPPLAFSMKESNVTAAFSDYLKNIISDKSYYNLRNADGEEKLNDYIQQLSFC